MKKHWKTFLLSAAVLWALSACANPAFTATDLTGAKTTAAAAANAPHSNVTAIAVTVATTPATLVAGTATNQVITVTFANGLVDDATLATAVTFSNLKAAANADGSYAEDDALTPIAALTNVVKNAAANTVVTYYFDFSTAANVSDWIVVSIDPTKLTADNGTKKLNLDSDLEQGEASDDAFFSYLNVPTGTKAVTVGVAKNPRLTFMGRLAVATFGAAAAAGATSLAITYSPPGTDATDYATLFDTVFELQKFDGTQWAKVALTSSTYASNVYTMNVAATVGKEVYRVKVNYSTTFVTTATLRGYVAKGSTDATKTVGYLDAGTIAEATATYNSPTINMHSVTGGMTIVSPAASKNNAVVTLTFTDTGALGLDPTTVTTSTVKLYNLGTQRYVPVSKFVQQSANVFVAVLDPTYLTTGGGLEVQFAPAVTDLGTTTSTTDDLLYGDWQNTASPPLASPWDHAAGWRIKQIVGATI
ncbi:MAG: hypothetical protein WCG80_15180 [Spirochaetales bacterium]